MNRVVFVSLTILCLLSVSSITGLIRVVKAEGGTITINADGSVTPSSAPIMTVDNMTYTFTANIINESIVVQRDNIVLDGAGFSLQGPELEMGADCGVDLSYRNKITLENVEINGFSRGLLLNYSYSNTISGNNITNCFCGAMIFSSSSNHVSGNSIMVNNDGSVVYKGYGIDIGFSSSNNTISENNITNGYYDGYALYGFAGVQIVGASSNSVSGNNITNNDYGVYLASLSNNNTILGNNIASNDRYGIILWQSSYNGISGNSMTANYNASIALEGSNNNTISGNSMTDSGCGVDLEAFGLGSGNNRICDNNITDNAAGVSFSYSSGNVFYNNNFVDNNYQVRSDNISANAWDDGSRGNYWSDYLIQCPNATETDGSGVWNTPYVIDANNTDYYPLTVQYVIPEFPSFLILPFIMMATLLAVIIYKKKGVKTSQS
jgi:parallel beta-helix repeat protein